MRPVTPLPSDPTIATAHLKRLLATHMGVFEPSDLDALQDIFNFINEEQKHRLGTFPANHLARRIIRLYRLGYRDRQEIRRLLIADGYGD